MQQDNMVIVGAGHAGARAAQSLRSGGWTGSITLLETEDRSPYERPPLSKAALQGRTRVEDLPLFPDAYLEDNNIILLGGVEVVNIDRAAQSLQLADGRRFDFHRLLLAPGATPRKLDVPGKDLAGIYSLRQAADAEALGRRLRHGADIVIVGGGLIGLEVAASASAQGCNVTVIEAGPRLMMRAAPALLAQRIRDLHESSAVRFRVGRAVVEMLGANGQLTAVRLDDGSVYPCTAAVISVGVTPRTILAQAAGLTIDNGIAVDARLRTSDPHIYAAGDACSFLLSSGERIRLENWKNAEDQGALAARNMLGADEAYDPFPWMWSDQFDKTMQIGGRFDGAVEHVERHCPDGTVLVFHLDGHANVIGVSGFGSAREVARGVRSGRLLIEQGVRPGKAALIDPGLDLRVLTRGAVA